jgi:hypothetical protein
MIPHTCTGPDCFGCRVKTVQFRATPAFQPHFNHSVGQFVSTDREYRDALKRCAEDQSARTGIDADYQPRYPGDTERPDTTPTEKLRHDNAVRARTIEPTRIYN